MKNSTKKGWEKLWKIILGGLTPEQYRAKRARMILRNRKGPFHPSIASEQARIAASGVSNYPPGFNTHLLD